MHLPGDVIQACVLYLRHLCSLAIWLTKLRLYALGAEGYVAKKNSNVTIRTIAIVASH